MSYHEDDWTPVPAGHARSASEQAAQTVILAPEDTGDGRSAWFWVRTPDPDNDLMLCCFPQGDTYFEVEHDFGRGPSAT